MFSRFGLNTLVCLPYGKQLCHGKISLNHRIMIQPKQHLSNLHRACSAKRNGLHVLRNRGHHRRGRSPSNGQRPQWPPTNSTRSMRAAYEGGKNNVVNPRGTPTGALESFTLFMVILKLGKREVSWENGLICWNTCCGWRRWWWWWNWSWIKWFYTWFKWKRVHFSGWSRNLLQPDISKKRERDSS